MATNVSDQHGNGHWAELSVEANADSIESVAELLSRYAYNEGIVIQEPYVQDADGDHFRVDPTRPVVITAYVPLDADFPATERRVRESLWHLRQLGVVSDLTVREVVEEDWANAWKEHFQVTRIGRRVVVRPSWRPYAAQPDEIVIDLDPGAAFGTGLHPTTALCVRALEERDLTGLRVLDAGAGSGILSIAAAKLGAAAVDAIEIDGVALGTLRHNINLNGLSDRVVVRQDDVTTMPPNAGVYDLIVANILSRILIVAAPNLTAALRPGGTLLLSGVIEAHEPEVTAAYEGLGLRVTSRDAAGDWVLLTAIKP